MAKRLPVPPELEHLIEKRERETERRAGEHRSGGDQRTADLGPLGAIESTGSLDAVPTEDRRQGTERRRSSDRRKKRRRNNDK